jgi:hypothetical protein
MFTSREWTDGFHKVVNFSQQLPHRMALMVAGYRVVKRLPESLYVVHPRRIDRLINHAELRVTFQPVLCFTALVDDVVIHDKRDGFCPSISRFQVLQQVDEQCRTLAVATNVTDFTRTTVQRSGQIIFFILPRCNNTLLLTAQLPVCTDFGIKVDIHFIFIKDRMLCAAFIQRFAAIFSSLFGSRMRNVGAALRHTSPADGNQRRTVPACNRHPVISLIFIARSSVLQRER